MRPKTPTIRSKKWCGRSFYLKIPMRTNSVEVLKAGTVVTTTGNLTKSRWFVCVQYPVEYKHGVMHLEDWVRRKDILNSVLVFPISPSLKKYIGFLTRRSGRTYKQALREIENFKLFARPS